MPFGREYEYAKASGMPSWMDEFADKGLSREATGESPFHELRSLFQQNKALTAVEECVRDMKDRIGLDLVLGAEEDSVIEKMASSEKQDLADFAAKLRDLADEYDAKGMRRQADAVDLLLEMTRKAADKPGLPLSIRATDESPDPPFSDDSRVKKIIDNIITSRKGQVSPWAIVQQLRSEFAKDVEKEELSPENKAIKKYIQDKINEMKDDVEEMVDDVAGLGVGLQSTQEDMDQENRMFEPTPQFQR